MYRSCALNVDQHRNTKPFKFRDQVNPKRTAARGVVFDTTFTPENTPTKTQNCTKRDEKKFASSNYSGRDKTSTFYSLSDSANKTDVCKRERKERYSEDVNALRKSPKDAHSLKNVDTRSNEIVQEELENRNWCQGVIRNRKRKLPQTLLSTLKRKPKVSILGYFEKQSKSASAQEYDLICSVSEPSNEASIVHQSVEHAAAEKNRVGVAHVVDLGDSDSESNDDKGFESKADQLAESSEERSNSSEPVKMKSEEIVPENDLVGVTSLEERDTCTVDSESNNNSDPVERITEQLKNTTNQTGGGKVKDLTTGTFLYDGDEPVGNKSVWNKESGSSSGGRNNESDEDCPFCSSHRDSENEQTGGVSETLSAQNVVNESGEQNDGVSGNLSAQGVTNEVENENQQTDCITGSSNTQDEVNEMDSENEEETDVNGRFITHDVVNEIDLIDDLLEDEASYLNETL